ncbi:immunoglobulin-like and fibronectin type III domain-containing protein 1 isoform X1 [Solea solea]|uniref:immunoglobulin-like and fibronectin type III domain-containing protein 1 isoform X1 n=1 Tax=Solea solea TaxID=90069 RepID=UPI00272A35D4|nr:immunoglobulin-like and fibronectin type III domain-containing protein 1 isoform X1 [Solea solea]
MWKRAKNSGPTARQSFSIVHRYIQHFNEVSGNKTALIRKRSKTPGVIITQYEVNIPEGKSTPDFQLKPVPVTFQKGKVAVFKAVVKGDPKPEVSWRRAKGTTSDKDKFQSKYDESTGEYRFEIHHVSAADTDTYTCNAVNKYGKAVCTATLSVTGDSTDGVEDLNLILKKMEEKKKERMQNMSKDDPDEDDDDDDDNATDKHCFKIGKRTKDFTIKSLIQESMGIMNQGDVERLNLLDTGLNQEDAEEFNLFLREFKLSNVGFVIKIQETKVQERDDALFECVLTHPLSSVTWMGKGSTLQDGEKYNITVSDHKLIHRLLVKDCKKQDKGIYSAVAGITSCSAWLVVEAYSEPSSACKTKPRKSTAVGGAQNDLEKVAKEQLLKSQKEMERILAAVKARHEAGQLKRGNTFTTGGRDGGNTALVTGLGRNAGAVMDKPEAARASALSEQTGHQEKVKTNNAKGDGISPKLDGSGCVTQTEAPVTVSDRRTIKSDQKDFNKLTGEIFYNGHTTDADDGGHSEESEAFTKYADNSRLKHGEKENGQNEDTDSGGNKRRSRGTRKIQRKQTSTQNEAAGDKDESDSEGDEDSISQVKEGDNDPNDAASDKDDSDSDSDEDSTGKLKHPSHTKQNQQLQTGDNERSDCDETVDATGSAIHTRRKRQGPLIEHLVIDQGVQFIYGLSDVSAIINEAAELTCKISKDDCEGAWIKDGKKISPNENVIITKDGAIHKLMIIRCTEEHSGKYRFEADGRKTEAMISVEDPPRFDPEDLHAFTEPVKVKVGHNAIFKLHFVGHEPIKVQWYREGEELQDDSNTKIEKSASHSHLLLSRCQRRESGEIKIKLKNEHGFTEAVSQLIVLDKPTSPLGPAEVTKSSAICIEFKWRPPKDNGGSPVTNYIIERQRVGRNTWKKLGEIPVVPCFRDTDVDHGRKYFYRVRAVTAEGTSEVMETDEMQAGTLAFPGPPAAPQVVSAFDDCINLCWASPSNRGGSRILGYILEKRKKGSNLWTAVNTLDELIKDKKYAVKDVMAGLEYEFRVAAINLSGAGEFSNPSEFVFARDPKKPPGKVTGLKVTETSYTHLVLTWTKPVEKTGIQDEAKGYFVEIRHTDCIDWSHCNSSPIITTSYSVKGLKSMAMYWVRVIATNDGGESAPEELPNYVIAMPSPVRPKFTNRKMKSFVVVRAGNSVRITVNFEASPWPDIIWMKDNVPMTQRATISNSDGSSQLFIPSSERSDSGIYSILVKNLAGQETFNTEVRVTDDPKAPGLVELEENVPGTVTVIWEPSPDEKRDDRLHYMVTKLDSTKQTWTTVAERLFNHKFTVCNIMLGREYNFRVYAKNDIGVSAPSESPTWGMEKKNEKFVLKVPTRKDCDLRCAPTFIVPLKLRTAPKGYECYMSCAVKGNPKPRITWYRNHISLNTNTNYYISETCGVCTMLILCMGLKDMGEYTICAENALGRAESSTIVSIRE